MTLRWGFKSEANNLALEVRKDLGLDAVSPLCPFELAEDLGIPVSTLHDLLSLDPSLNQHVALLIDSHRSAFSAITIFSGQRRCIVHNHRHASRRQRSNIAHELAHALLMHPPHPPSCSGGDRIYKRDLEEEAGWLGPVLLVPNEAARWALVKGLSVSEAADRFQVSEELMQFRLRMSGTQQIVKRMSRVG